MAPSPEISLSLSSLNRQEPTTERQIQIPNTGLPERAAASPVFYCKNEPCFTAVRTIKGRTDWRLCRETPFQGAGSSQVRPTRVETLHAALCEYINDLTYAAGYDPVQPARPSPY